MSKERRCFRIGLRYKYAPETCYIQLLQQDGSYKTLDVDTSGYMWGYWLSIGEKEKAIAEVKHFLRSRNKAQKRLVTYGFFIKDSSTEYVYCDSPWSFAHEYNTAEKLVLYKGFKKQLFESGCKHHRGTTATLNGKYEVESKEEEYDEVDLTRPVKVYVNIR